jgi:hypothetical protein
VQYTVTEFACLLYWQELDTPYSLSLAIRARYGDWEGVLRSVVNPKDYLCTDTVRKNYAANSFCKKNPFIKGISQEDRRKAALASWYQAEDRCFRTNTRIRLLSMAQGPAWDFLLRVRKRLLDWIDPKPQALPAGGVKRFPRAPSDEEIHSRARHGPGSTFSSIVRNPTAADKYSERPSVTRNAIWHIADLVGTQWGAEMATHFKSSYEDCIQVVKGNRHETVPKTALTDRSIAIEPSINVYFQLALGSAIRDRLRTRCGWDLDNAASIHRKMAMRASIDGSFATLDLSNASDTIARELVTVLFGDSRWLSLLSDLRSSFTLIEGKWRLLEKFSSMGNGYTFELETLVFSAICSVALEIQGHVGILGHDLFVFGDDIIIPSDCVTVVQSALEFCGFQINKEKSFVDGPFRESCGGDYFLGTPVRGYYLKRELDEPDALYACHNGAKKVMELCGFPTRFLGWVLSRLPIEYRSIGGPDRLGDTVLNGLSQVVKWKNGVRWVKIVKWRKPARVGWGPFSDGVRLACRLTGHGDSWGITSRGEVRSGEVVWVSDS